MKFVDCTVKSLGIEPILSVSIVCSWHTTIAILLLCIQFSKYNSVFCIKQNTILYHKSHNIILKFDKLLFWWSSLHVWYKIMNKCGPLVILFRQFSLARGEWSKCMPKPDYGPVEVQRSRLMNGVKVAAAKPFGAQMGSCTIMYQV